MIKWYFLENLFSAACSSSHLSFRVSIKKTIKPNSFHFKLLNNLFHELGIGISLSIRLNPVISNIPNMSEAEENLTLPSHCHCYYIQGVHGHSALLNCAALRNYFSAQILNTMYTIVIQQC